MTSKIYRLVVVVLILVTSGNSFLQAEPLSAEQIELASMATHDFRQSGKIVKPIVNAERLKALQGSAQTSTVKIADTLSRRNAHLGELEQEMENLKKRMQEAVVHTQSQMMMFLFSEAFTPAGENYTRDNVRGFVNGMKRPVGNTLSSQENMLRLATEQVSIENELRADLMSLRVPPDQSEGEPGKMLLACRLDRDKKQKVCLSIKNQTQLEMHSALIFIELDCDYEKNAQDTLKNVVGSGLSVAVGADPLDMLELGLAYEARDEAQRQFLDQDKGVFVFSKRWKNNEFIDVDIDAIIPFLLFCKTVRIAVLSDEIGIRKIDLSMEDAKKKVLKLYRDEVARRRSNAIRAARRNSQFRPGR